MIVPDVSVFCRESRDAALTLYNDHWAQDVTLRVECKELILVYMPQTAPVCLLTLALSGLARGGHCRHHAEDRRFANPAYQ